ncbi:GWT1-domain-containing protein [Russula vinacea]|nr:GWT1-domain-containing protein [Russula vinacea]
MVRIPTAKPGQGLLRRRRVSTAMTMASEACLISANKALFPSWRCPPRNDKTATVLFSYADIYWTLFGISRYLHIGGPDVSRRLVNLPYIAWVAAYNTSVLLCYLLLDLAFFPTPLSKSTYSPVSGLKVVRRPSSDNEHHDVPDSACAPVMTSGPSPMPAPPLLEAVNRNSLAVFLLYMCANLCLCGECPRGCGTSGERGDWCSEPIDADYVCLEWTCDVGIGSVCVWRVCVRVGDEETSGVEVIKRGTGVLPGIHA